MTTRSSIRFGVHFRLRHAAAVAALAAAGIALGVDRMVMLLAGASTIDDVVAFPPETL